MAIDDGIICDSCRKLPINGIFDKGNVEVKRGRRHSEVLFVSGSAVATLASWWYKGSRPWNTATVIGALCGFLVQYLMMATWDWFKRKKTLHSNSGLLATPFGPTTLKQLCSQHGLYLADLGRRGKNSTSPPCPLCTYFTSFGQSYPSDQHTHLHLYAKHCRQWIYGSCHRWNSIRDSDPWENECNDICVFPSDFPRNGVGYGPISLVAEAGILIGTQDPGNSKFLQAQLIPPTIDWTKVRLWINPPFAGSRQIQNRARKTIIRRMKLIDCDSFAIVSAERTFSWVALSYVWGLANGSVRLHEQGLSSRYHTKIPPTVPNVVADAIRATKSLGFQYLWIDRYCINQQDGNDVKTQIAQMDLIYRGAEVVLVAISNQDGLPGVGSIPRVKQNVIRHDSVTLFESTPDPKWLISHSTWHERGWTFQEAALARKKLYFTDYQVIFECSEYTCNELLGGPELARSDADMDKYLAVMGAPDNGGNLWSHYEQSAVLESISTKGCIIAMEEQVPREISMQEYLHVIYKFINFYTLRKLSDENDSLNGIMGILKLFEGPGLSISTIQGIPCLGATPAYNANFTSTSRNHFFIMALCWHHIPQHPPEPPIRRKMFPSWSWAGWQGEVSAGPGGSPQPILKQTRDHEFIVGADILQIEGACSHVARLARIVEIFPTQPGMTEYECPNHKPLFLYISGHVVPPSAFVAPSQSYFYGHNLPVTKTTSSQYYDEAEIHEALTDSDGEPYECLFLGGEEFHKMTQIWILILCSEGTETSTRVGIARIFIQRVFRKDEFPHTEYLGGKKTFKIQ